VGFFSFGDLSLLDLHLSLASTTFQYFIEVRLGMTLPSPIWRARGVIGTEIHRMSMVTAGVARMPLHSWVRLPGFAGPDRSMWAMTSGEAVTSSRRRVDDDG